MRWNALFEVEILMDLVDLNIERIDDLTNIRLVEILMDLVDLNLIFAVH